MKNVNQRRKYSDIKQFNECCADALHKTAEKIIEGFGCVIRCGGERDFIKADPVERRQQIIDKNRKTLDKYYNALVKTEGFVERSERLNKISLKRPDESMRSDG